MDNTSSPSRPKCKMCSKTFYGRSDKKFCTVRCKSTYHYRLKKAHLSQSYKLNFQLLKNREIIEALMGEKKIKYIASKAHMLSLEFDFDVYNRKNIRTNGKIYYYAFNYSWSIEEEHVHLHKLEEKKLKTRPISNHASLRVQSS